MLCEKCKNRSFDDSPSAKAQGFVMGLPGRKPCHQYSVNHDGTTTTSYVHNYQKWFPGESRKDLEDWCAKNCKPVEEKVITPVTEKVKMVGSNKNWLKKDKKKD